MILRDSLISLNIKFQDRSVLPDYIFFNNSRPYPPLWIFTAMQRNIQIYYYFYSTNIQSLDPLPVYNQARNIYTISNWPNYIVWDKWQSDFIKQSNNFSKNIIVSGTIPFSDSGETIAEVGPALSIFDVQPLQPYLSMLTLPYEMYSPRNYLKFMTDIISICEDLNVKILWKRKREVGNLAHPLVSYLLKIAEQKKNVILVPPSISALRILSISKCSISIPFTSTAVAGASLSKPSVYYDPTNTLRDGNEGAHGIKIITCYGNLKN